MSNELKFNGWKNLNHEPKNINDFLEYCLENCDTIYVGTDSFARRSYIKYTTALVGLGENGKSKIITRSAVDHNMCDLRTRLMNETWASIDIAMLLKDEWPGEVMIHCDVNNDIKFKSGKFKNEVQGYVHGFGFDCEIKPNAWCASAVADALTR